MNGLRVKIDGSSRVWHVLRDTGDELLVAWIPGKQTRETRWVSRADVVEREEPGIGWVSTEMTP